MTHSDTLFETAFATPRALPMDGKRPLKRLMMVVTAGVTALSLMMATAVPAHADRASDNLAKALIAALAIGAVVNSIDRGHATPAPTPAPAPVPVHDRRATIPGVCAVEIRGGHRDRVVYPSRCLREEGFRGRLPDRCAITIRMNGRIDDAYGERCLRDAGYRIGGGRDDRWDDRGDRGHGHGRGRGGYGS